MLTAPGPLLPLSGHRGRQDRGTPLPFSRSVSYWRECWLPEELNHPLTQTTALCPPGEHHSSRHPRDQALCQRKVPLPFPSPRSSSIIPIRISAPQIRHGTAGHARAPRAPGICSGKLEGMPQRTGDPRCQDSSLQASNSATAGPHETGGLQARCPRGLEQPWGGDLGSPRVGCGSHGLCVTWPPCPWTCTGHAQVL